MTLQSIESQIVTEYGIVMGWAKNHVLLFGLACLAVGFVVKAVF